MTIQARNVIGSIENNCGNLETQGDEHLERVKSVFFASPEAAFLLCLTENCSVPKIFSKKFVMLFPFRRIKGIKPMNKSVMNKNFENKRRRLK